MPLTNKEIVIIGGGYAGLSSAALLSEHCAKLTLIESHNYLGGCASFFRRGPFTFDCGATTLSGLKTGRPLNILTSALGIEFNPNPLKIPITVTLSNGTKIRRFSDHQQFIKELNEKFPNLDNQSFWEELKNLEENLWEVLASSQYFPPKNSSDFLNLIDKNIFKKLKLGAKSFVTLESILPDDIRNNHQYREFLDQLLLISTQSKSHQVPVLIGAMGLMYPEDMYYPQGGISSLAYKLKDIINKYSQEILMRTVIKEVIPNGDKFILKTQGPGGLEKEINADIVISSLPVWNTKKLFKQEYQKFFKTPDDKNCWGAITAYFAVRFKSPIENLYHQIHYKSENFKEGSFFFSFSDSNDLKRAPEGWQTVTVSTHENPDKWFNPAINYKEQKNQYLKEILTLFTSSFESNVIEEIKFEALGTPRTFNRFTRRYGGLVGGLPHNLKNNILTFPSQETKLENFYQIGDTTFPGQGIVGVTTGSLILTGKLLDKNFFS